MSSTYWKTHYYRSYDGLVSKVPIYDIIATPASKIYMARGAYTYIEGSGNHDITIREDICLTDRSRDVPFAASSLTWEIPSGSEIDIPGSNWKMLQTSVP